MGGFQAAWRGVLARRAAQQRRRDVAAAKIAASWRMYLFRKAFVQRRRYDPLHHHDAMLLAPVDLSPQSSAPHPTESLASCIRMRSCRNAVHSMFQHWSIGWPAWRDKMLTGWAQAQDSSWHMYYLYTWRDVGPGVGSSAWSFTSM